MMKITLYIIILLLCCQCIYARDTLKVTDSLSYGKQQRNTLLVKLHSANSYGMMKPGTNSYNFKSMFGTGAELIVGFKLYEKTALGFGLQRTQFFINQSKIEKALTETYTQPWSKTYVTVSGNSSLIQKNYFIYLSAWKQQSNSVFEYYLKMNLTSFHYRLHSQVQKKYDFPVRSTMVSYEGGITNTGFMAGAGINYSRRVSKIFYISGGLQYSYNLTPRTSLYEKNVFSTGEEVTYIRELPVPSHIMQLNIGLMYRPKKACNCKTQKVW